MNSNRIWAAGAAVIAVILLVVTYLLGVSPMFASLALAEQDRIAVEQNNELQRAALADLKDKFENIDELRRDLAEARKVIPAGLAQDEWVASFQQYQRDTNVVASVIFKDPVPFVAAAEAKDPELAAALGAVNATNFLVVPVTFSAEGEFDDLLKFYDKLQKGERLFLLHDLVLTEYDVGETALEMSAEGQIFIFLDPEDQLVPPVDPAAAPAEGAEE